MVNHASNIMMSIPETALTTPTSAQAYPLGTELYVTDQTSATPVVNRYLYVKSHGTLTVYVPYVLNYTGTAGSELKTAAPATLAAPGNQVVVPQVAFTSGYYGFVQIEGNCTCALASETKAVGDMLQVLNTGTTLMVDGTSGATTYSVNTCAISKSATTAAGNRSIYLLRRQAVVAAT